MLAAAAAAVAMGRAQTEHTFLIGWQDAEVLQNQIQTSCLSRPFMTRISKDADCCGIKIVRVGSGIRRFISIKASSRGTLLVLQTRRVLQSKGV